MTDHGTAPLPPELDTSHTEALVGLGPVHDRLPVPTLSVGPDSTVTQRIRRRMRRSAREGARLVAAPLIRRMYAAIAQSHDELSVRLDAHQADLDTVRVSSVDAQLRWAEIAAVAADIEGNRINTELLKGEVRHLEYTLDELGMAFAPATGLAGAAARFSELRESVQSLQRNVRDIGRQNHDRSTGEDGGAPGPVPVGGDPATSSLFNYVGFEQRFRGDAATINEILMERYGELLLDHQPVVDIGCGRGELLELLAARGAEVLGVEPEPGMAVEARSRGITVHQAYAGEFLRTVDDHSLGSVITTHVAEHLPLDALIEMLELSVRKLAPGGLFISETPNPASLIVLGNSYILDPTHVMPLHPSLFTFLCESAGFRDVRVRFYAPATGYHLQHVSVPDGPAWAESLAGQLNTELDRLNDVLFGPQEYAVIATTPAG